MDKSRLPNSIFFMLCVLTALQLFYYSARVPDVMGSHFGASGAVNGWQSKTAFFVLELALLVLASVISFGVPRLIAAMPISLINLPHKDIWLAPERREQTLLYIRTWSVWFGCGLLTFLLFVMELAFRANLQAPPHFNNSVFVPALLAFVAFDLTLLVRLLLHFAKAPAE